MVRSEGGASLVEFALLAPLLFAILLGTITAGLALAAKNSMTNAVREGSRLGATLPEGTDWSTEWAVDVKDRVLQLAGGDIEGDEVCVELVSISTSSETIEGSWPAAGGCPLVTSAPTTPTSAESGTCVVKVWARRTAELEVIFFSRSLTLDANAIGVYERTPCP